MDDEKSGLDAPARSTRLPRTEITGEAMPAGPSTGVPMSPPPRAAAVETTERDGIFRQLVKEDADIAGLVAYSIYKQNKLDWLTAFEQAKGRAPTPDEQASYIIGEGTPRRLVTYRHLAEAMLAGTGPDGPGRSAGATRPGQAPARPMLTPSMVAIYAMIAALLVVGFVLAAHYTVSTR